MYLVIVQHPTDGNPCLLSLDGRAQRLGTRDLIVKNEKAKSRKEGIQEESILVRVK